MDLVQPPSRGMLDRFLHDPFRRDRGFSDTDSAFGNQGLDLGWQSTAGSAYNAFAPYRPVGASAPILGVHLLDLINSLWDGRVRSALSTVDVKETADAYVFQTDAPGFLREDLKVQVDDIGPGSRLLVISGQRRRVMQSIAEDDGNVMSMEKTSDTFVRRFRLPEDSDPDSTTAHCEQGDLTVIVPKVGAILDQDASLADSQALRIEEVESEEEELERQQQREERERKELVDSINRASNSAASAAGAIAGLGGTLNDGRDLNPDMADMSSGMMPGSPRQPDPELSAAANQQETMRTVVVMSPNAGKNFDVEEVEAEMDFEPQAKVHQHKSGWKKMLRKLSTTRKWGAGKQSKRRS